MLYVGPFFVLVTENALLIEHFQHGVDDDDVYSLKRNLQVMLFLYLFPEV